MKDRTEMSEHTQNLLGRLDEQFAGSDKPFGLLSPPEEGFKVLEKIEETESRETVQATPEVEPTALSEPAGEEVVAAKESSDPPAWFHLLNTSLEESRSQAEKKAETIEREIRDLRNQSRQPQAVVPPVQNPPNFDPNALASMGDVANIQNLTQRELGELRQAQYHFAMRAESDRAKAAYERVKVKYPDVSKLYDSKQFEDIWSRWTANDPRRSAMTDWETELTTAYKSKQYESMESKISDLTKQLESLKKVQAQATPEKVAAAKVANKNLTLVPRPTGSRQIDTPTEKTNPFFKKGGSFKNFGRELLRSSQGA